MAVVKVDIVVDDKGAAGIQKFSGAIENAGQRANALQSILQGIGQGFGQKIFDGAMAVVGWLQRGATAAIAWADKFGVVAAKMQTTAESAQRLAHIGQQTDTSLEAITGSIDKMQKALAGDGDVFRRLGLSAEELKRAKPEEALATIADKLNGLESPTQRAEAARAIFGKGWQEMAPLLEAGGAKIRELAEETDRLGLRMNEGAIAAGRDLDDTITKLGEVMDGFWRNVGAGIVTSEPLHTLLEGLVEILGLFSKGVQDGESDIRSFVDLGVVFLAQALVELVGVVEVGLAVWKSLADMWSINRVALEALIAPMKLLWQLGSGVNKAEAWKEYLGSTTGAFKKLKTELDQHQADLDKSVGVTSKMRDAMQQLSDKVAANVGVTHKASDTNQRHADSLGQTGSALKKATAEHEKWLETLARRGPMGPSTDELLQMQTRFGTHFTPTAGPNMAAKEVKAAAVQLIDLTGVGEKGVSFGKQFATGMKTGISGAMKDLPNVIMAAIQGGGNVGAAIGSLFGASIGKSIEKPVTDALSGALGKKLGGALGSMIPGIGAAVGPLLGQLGGKLLGGLFGGGEHKKVNDLRDQFVAAAGGITELDKRAKAAGLSVDRLLAAKKVKDFESAVQQLNDAFGLQEAATTRAQEAADRYGISLVSVQQQLDETAGQLIGDWDILAAKHVDVAEKASKMAPAVNDYLKAAREAGTEIPERMRPMLEQMLKMGLLTDDAGNKLENLDGFTFTETLSEGLAKAIDGINRLVAALTGAQHVGSQGIHVPVRFEQEGDPGGQEGIPHYAGGARNLTRAHLAVVGDVPEDIVPRTEREAYARNVLRGEFGGGGGGLTVNVDARYSSDPVAMEAAALRGVNAALKNGTDGGETRRRVAGVQPKRFRGRR